MHFIKSYPSANNAALVETRGLHLLNETIEAYSISELSIPKIIEQSSTRLTLQFISAEQATPQLWRLLGKGLAKLHTIPQQQFGLDYDNYIGLAPQINQLHRRWGECFMSTRLRPQAAMIKNSNVANMVNTALHDNYKTVEQLLDESCDTASLLHGDLWSGNVMFGDGKVWLIDPAVYYGDSEVDLAMSEMFGGFSHEFYHSYWQERAVSSEYERKKNIYDLYHYLNHYNLFGDSYLSNCERLLSWLYKL